MTKQHLTTAFTVDETPEAAFAAINNVRGWWSGDIDGATSNSARNGPTATATCITASRKSSSWRPASASYGKC